MDTRRLSPPLTPRSPASPGEGRNVLCKSNDELLSNLLRTDDSVLALNQPELSDQSLESRY